MADFVACPGCGDEIVFPESCDQCFEQFCGGQCRDYHTCKAEEVNVAEDTDLETRLRAWVDHAKSEGTVHVAIPTEAMESVLERLKDPCVHESAIVQNALDAQGDAETEMMWLRLQLDVVTAFLDAHEAYGLALEGDGNAGPLLSEVEATYKALDWANRPRCTFPQARGGGVAFAGARLCGRIIPDGDRCRTHRKMEEAASRVPELADADDGLSPAPWVAGEVVDDGRESAGCLTMTDRGGRRCTFYLPTLADARFVAEARNRLAKHRGGS